MTHYLLGRVRYVLVAVAAAGILTGTIDAATASAPLSVSATVVRSCKVDSAPSSGSVSLACSKDVTAVKVTGVSASDVLVMPAETPATPVPADSVTATSADSTARFVTVNF
jgi:hypothetical protein